MTTAPKDVYLTPQGKASLESDEGKNEKLAVAHSQIDDATLEELGLAKLFEEDAKASAAEAEKSGTLIEQAKARQSAAKDAAKTEHKATPKTETVKNLGKVANNDTAAIQSEKRAIDASKRRRFGLHQHQHRAQIANHGAHAGRVEARSFDYQQRDAARNHY